MHFLPVFSWDDEAGWLLLVPKADPAITKALRSVSKDDDIAPERKVLSWWVSHGLENKVVTALRPREFCPQCLSGVPCGAWDEDLLSFHEFEARAPGVTGREEWDRAVKEVLRGLHEEGPKYLKSFARKHANETFGKEEAGVIAGFVDSMFAAAETVFGQNASYIPPEGRAWQAPGAGPAQPAGMSAERAREVLKVNADATPAQVKRAFVMRSMEAHPDKGGTAEQMKEVLEARRVLTGD